MTNLSYDPFRGSDSGQAAQEEAKANEVPTGTIPELMEWVGDDKDRAQQVLDAEKENEKPRKSLIKDLEGIIGD